MKYAHLLVILSAFLFSCNNNNPRQDPATTADSSGVFKLPEEYTHRQTMTYEYDANSDGHNDVLLVLKDSSYSQIRKDSLVLFLFNSKDTRYNRTSFLGIENVSGVQMQNIDNDPLPELLVSTDGGGSSETASRGMLILKLNNLSYQSMKDIPYGAPTFLLVDSIPTLVLHDTYSGFISRSESAQYIDSLIALAPIESNRFIALCNRYFIRTEQGLLQEVDSLMKHPEKGDSYGQELFSKVVGRVMILRKLQRNRESEEFIRSVNRRAKFMPRRFKDALEEVQMDIS